MKLKVIEWHPAFNLHVCEQENGERVKVDLMVGCGLKVAPISLVGETVECAYLFPHQYLAMDVQLVK